MAKAFLAVDLAQHVAAGLLELAEFRDEGEHHRQGPPVRRPQQGLKLHPQHARLVQTDPDRPPAHGGVRLVIGLHVGQHLVRADVEGAERHRQALGGIHDAGIKHRKFAPLGHLVADQELQLGAKQPDPFGP